MQKIIPHSDVLLVGNPATEPVRGFVVFNIYGLLDNRFVHLCVD